MAAATTKCSVVLALVAFAVFSLVSSGASVPSKEEYLEMKKYLKFMNRPGVKTIESESGQVFVCVDVNKQPALDHPMLINHTIEMAPQSTPKGRNTEVYPESMAMKTGLPDGGCPVGSVPIRKIKMEELIGAGSVSKFMHRHGKGHKAVEGPQTGTDHQYAITSLTGGTYQGTEVSISLWSPKVKESEAFSLSQLWVINGPSGKLNTIEAGWYVFPYIYKQDSAPHLFVYWTADGYDKTGCYNLECPGFVQLSQSIAPGMRLTKLSSYGGTQEAITLETFWEKTARWWLGCRESQSSNTEWVGYWPGSLFTTLVGTANRVGWGGEVFPGGSGGTLPEMGSGHFASEGYGKAAHMKQIKYVDESFTLKDIPSTVSKLETRPNCYTFIDEETGGAALGRYFLYGGHGGVC